MFVHSDNLPCLAELLLVTRVCVCFFFSQDVLPSIHVDPEYPCELVGTWNTWYGEQDQAGTIVVPETAKEKKSCHKKGRNKQKP